jgi:hypothetical protein
MERDADKTKETGAGQTPPVNKDSDKCPESSRECKEGRGGWRDVFDNIEYSAGPGDNIYVFG